MRTTAETAAVLVIVAWTTLVAVPTSIERAMVRAGSSATAANTQGSGTTASVQATLRSPQTVRALAGRSAAAWAVGILALLAGRLLALRKHRRAIAVAFLLPPVALITGLGLALHWAYDDPLRAEILGGQLFSQGVLLGGLLAAVTMALPIAPEQMIARHRWMLVVSIFALLGALYFFGESPGLSGARVRLLGVQPIEAIKLAFVAMIATFFGRHAEQLRYQRARRGWLEIPRPRLLAPAGLLVVALFLGLYLVRDFGPTLVLALVLLALYYAVTRSWAELAVLVGLASAAFAAAISPAGALLPPNVAIRVAMMRDPWLNGQPGGDQLAASLWAFAAGGGTGRGLGQAAIGALPAGHTDLILAHLAEVAGLVGLGLYLALLLLVVLQGCWIGLRNRTPERMLLACGLAALIFAQLLIIFGGSSGLLPLTGIVVPFLSFGRTSMVVFLLLVALLVRLAAQGKPRQDHDALRQVRGGIVRVTIAILLLAGVTLVTAACRTLVGRAATMTRGVLAIGFDDAVFLRYDPRLKAIARRMRRGAILDRHGVTLAGSDDHGARSYPLGAAMGTLIGVREPTLGMPPWALEGVLDARLRGLGTVHAPLAVWVLQWPDEVLPDGSLRHRRDRILFTVATHTLRPTDLARARRLQAAAERAAAADSPAGNAVAENVKHSGAQPHSTRLLFSRLRQLDHSPLVPVAMLRGTAREAAIQALAEDVAARSIELSIDARLQRFAARTAEDIARGRGQAAAVAILDVDSAQVLARAQWPDIDPARAGAWIERVRSADPRFTGSYGPWKDKTGALGLYQAGSIFKLFTAFAWLRQQPGPTLEPASAAGTDLDRCQSRTRETFACQRADATGPFFTRAGWSAPIHDSHPKPDGVIDLSRALAVSCNVFFGQLGLALGNEPLVRLARDGLEIDNGRGFPGGPGTAGSRRLAATAFGQGAARMHVLEAARLVAAIASGGIYRRCPPSMVRAARCEERRLIDDPGRLLPILAGMRHAVSDGTARRLHAPPGVRLYAKTGTASDPGRADEAPYGLEPGKPYREHSWLVAIAEPDSQPPCAAQAPGRLAFAAVVPRGGAGAGLALRIVQRLVDKTAALGLLKPEHATQER